MEIPPVNLDLKDDATTMCLRPYPVMRVQEAMFRKEVKILVKLGVLEEADYSKWRASSFDQPKPKTNPARFLNDFHNLNRELKRKPYSMPKIREILLNLWGFQYATSLDFKMGYDHIQLRN